MELATDSSARSRRSSDGCVWATTLCGRPGFINAIDDTNLRVSGKQMYGDPARLSAGAAFGIVGVMLHNRRRNKLNGVVESIAQDHISLRITHSLGNCPKYIQGMRAPLKTRQNTAGSLCQCRAVLDLAAVQFVLS